MAWSNNRGMEMKAPSGLTLTWRLWRHCCCRYGWYPLLVAPIVTSGCLLSLYSSAGCDFLRVNVGFTPSNSAWSQSTAELGLFYYQSGIPDDNKYKSALLDGCRPYEDQFNIDFIEDDRTWKVAKIMALISGSASILAMVTSWLFVITPLPVFFFWPGVLLPALMAAFLSEGSKFLFFDTSICRNTVWFPSGTDSLPRVADTCVLGSTGNYSIAGGAIFFLSLILVCLKAPEKRSLHMHYGEEFGNESDLESPHNYGPSLGSYGEGSQPMYLEEGGSFEENRHGRHDRSGASEMTYTPRGTRRVPKEDAEHFDPAYDYRVDERKGFFFRNHNLAGENSSTENSSDGRDPSIQHRRDPSLDYRDDEADDLVMARMKTLDSSEDRYTARPKNEVDDLENDDRYQPTKPKSIAPPPDLQRVSESRVHTIEKMELNTTAESEDMIEKFVSDLNLSFQLEQKEEQMKNKQLHVETPGLCSTVMCAAPSSARSF